MYRCCQLPVLNILRFFDLLGVAPCQRLADLDAKLGTFTTGC
jgi:hypothetical protein